MSKPTCTNSPTSSSVVSLFIRRLRLCQGGENRDREVSLNELSSHESDDMKSFVTHCDIFSQDIYCGGYSGEDPPLPIPNREVKLTIADGTAPPGGRVGSCHYLYGKL